MKRVLVVEDDPEIREALEMLLVEQGYEVLAAAHGGEALELLQRPGEPPSVIVLDLMMPVMNGWELLDALHARPPLDRIPVVVVSAHTDRAPHGVACVLRKPVRVDTLLDAIEHA